MAAEKSAKTAQIQDAEKKYLLKKNTHLHNTNIG